MGNNNPAKGIDPLLRAFAAADLEAYLVLVGASAQRWQPLCDALGITAKIRMIDHSEHVSDYLHAADAFVFPSRDMDSAPNTLLEAINKAKPAAAKGQYVRSCVVASTMGPGIKVSTAKMIG